MSTAQKRGKKANWFYFAVQNAKQKMDTRSFDGKKTWSDKKSGCIASIEVCDKTGFVTIDARQLVKRFVKNVWHQLSTKFLLWPD